MTDESERATRRERCRQQRKFTHWSDPDGMCHTKLSLDPLADAQMWALINQTLAAQSAISGEVAGDMTDDHRTFDQRRADILLDLICRPGGLNGVGDSGGHAANGAEVSVVIDLDTGATPGLARDHRQTRGDRRQVRTNAGAGIAVGTRAGIGAEWNEAHRIVNDVIARRQAAHDAENANTTRQHRQRHDAPEPLPLFGTDDTIRHRGPPQAS